MKWLVKLSVNRPKTVIAVILVITLFFGYMIATRATVNVDPMKSFSRKMDVIKYYHLTLKKFSMKDMILIGVENEKEGIFNVETVRYVEQVINRFKALKVTKTYKSIITGKEETVEVPSKLTTGQILSIINADDVMVNKATNTIVIGNLTSKAREKSGLITRDPEEMKILPKRDADLKKLIPFLKKELMTNDLLKGTLFSADGKACAIMVPIEKRIDNKLEIIRREMPLMVNAEKLRARFNGNDSYFPAKIYNKKVDGKTVDDEYIKDEVESNKKKIRSYFVKHFKPFSEYNKDFYATLKKSEVNEDYLNAAFRMMESDSIYEKPDISITYQDFIDDLYRFIIENIDPFSRNNLESKFYNVTNIYDVGHIYKLFNKLSAENKPKDIKIYIAGMPVAEAILEEFVTNDLSLFMSICIALIFIILFLTIRTPTGIYLPLTTVVISIIWLMGGMLMMGIEISSGTMAMPSILIANASSYVIHFLVRYYEKIEGKTRAQVKPVLIDTADSIDTAITLSALTTMAAFLSNLFMDIIDIQRMGLLLSTGFFINLMFTFSFVPACLSFLPPPKGTKETLFERTIMAAVVRGGENTARHPRTVFWGALGITAVFFVGLFFLKTESSISFMFLEKNPIRQADKFINKELTGTGQMCIVFKMRDKVNLANEEARKDLTKKAESFLAAYRNFQAAHPDLKNSRVMNAFFIDDLAGLIKDPVRNQSGIQERVTILGDILNEFYEYDQNNQTAKTKKSAAKAPDSGDLSDMATSYAESSGSNAVETSQDIGVRNIIGRIKTLQKEEDKASAKRFISSIRNYKYSAADKEFLGKFYVLSDFFHTDVTQPVTLRKIDALGKDLKNLREPNAVIDDVKVKPVGNVMSVTDTLKVIYKVFYHDDNSAFQKIPDVKKDGIHDKSITDRSIIGVCMSQFLASREDIFKYLVTDDMKYMQFIVFTRSDKADFLNAFKNEFDTILKNYFPENDPYVEKIVISGMPAINLKMNEMILNDQISSLLLTIFIVFLCCLFMFRSFFGALFATVPISFTLIITLGTMGFIGIPINYSTLINASIAVGSGIDFSIEFIERFKIEHNIKKLSFIPAYTSTLKTTGVSIVTATLTMGIGFAVLGLSSFKIIKVSGLLVTLSMVLSGAFALTVLPAMLVWAKPKFLKSAKPWGIEEKVQSLFNTAMNRAKFKN